MTSITKSQGSLDGAGTGRSNLAAILEEIQSTRTIARTDDGSIVQHELVVGRQGLTGLTQVHHTAINCNRIGAVVVDSITTIERQLTAHINIRRKPATGNHQFTGDIETQGIERTAIVCQRSTLTHAQNTAGNRSTLAKSLTEGGRGIGIDNQLTVTVQDNFLKVVTGGTDSERTCGGVRTNGQGSANCQAT